MGIISSIGTFGIALSSVHMNVCDIQYVNFIECMRVAYLSFNKIRLAMYRRDNNECITMITMPVTHLKGICYFFV